MTTSGRVVMTTRAGLAASSAGLVALLAGLVTGVGLDARAVLVGLLCQVVLGAAVARALVAPAGLGPADLVTLSRTTLACGLAALVSDAYLRGPAVSAVVATAVLALVLDAVDGRVARRSETVSAFGARFDGEADAFLLLVLSAYVAPATGAWVWAIGLARYLFGAAGWVLPWLSGPLPFRYWRKVVAAVQGVVLCAAAAGVLAPGPRNLALLVALALLVESFGRDVVWLWRHRPAESVAFAAAATTTPAP